MNCSYLSLHPTAVVLMTLTQALALTLNNLTNSTALFQGIDQRTAAGVDISIGVERCIP